LQHAENDLFVKTKKLSEEEKKGFSEEKLKYMMIPFRENGIWQHGKKD